MKKLSTLVLLMMLFTAPFVFTSCNEPTDDEYLAMLVEGGWDGIMDISYTKNDVNYPSTGTHVQFWNYANSTTSGTGKWCNQFGNTAPIKDLTYEFTWEAKDKVIYLHFKTDNNEYAEKGNMKIGTYVINSLKFTGKISTLDGSKGTDFELIHTSAPWDWDAYIIWYWDIYPFYPWYDPWYDPFYW